MCLLIIPRGGAPTGYAFHLYCLLSIELNASQWGPTHNKWCTLKLDMVAESTTTTYDCCEMQKDVSTAEPSRTEPYQHVLLSTREQVVAVWAEVQRPYRVRVPVDCAAGQVTHSLAHC